MKPKSYIARRYELRRAGIDPNKADEPRGTEARIYCASCTTDPQRPAITRHTFRCEMQRARDGAYAEHWGCDGCGNMRVFGVNAKPQRPGLGVH